MKRILPAFLAVLLFGISCKKEEPNQEPEVQFVRPLSSDSLYKGELVDIELAASDPDGEIERLVLMADGQQLAVLTTKPYRFRWDAREWGGGTITLKARAIDDQGAEAEASRSFFLIGNTAPQPGFSFSPDPGIVQELVYFDASLSSDQEDSLSTLLFRWDFDGDSLFETSWDANPLTTHTYNQEGNYAVGLEVKDSEGLTAVLYQSITVVGPVLLPPVAAFSLVPDSGNMQTTFSVNAGASYDPDGADHLLSYRWDWDGDGTFDTPFLSDSLAFQIYPDTGRFRIILEVKDADGLTDTVSRPVIVFDPFPGLQPCPGIPTVSYAGQTYNTLKLGSRCWLRENLNVGTMVSTTVGQQQNSTIEKFCFNNNPVNCQVYGGLYQWDEAMAWGSPGQDICPLGWHIATDEDYKHLEGMADTQYDTLAGIWDSTGFRGLDAAKVLKSASGWSQGGNGSNQLFFNALPAGGTYGSGGTSVGQGSNAMFWTSQSVDTVSAMARFLDAPQDGAYRGAFQKVNAFSVRCVKD
jgi:uncharacterized protein (TIGR02145 family)